MAENRKDAVTRIDSYITKCNSNAQYGNLGGIAPSIVKKWLESIKNDLSESSQNEGYFDNETVVDLFRGAKICVTVQRVSIFKCLKKFPHLGIEEMSEVIKKQIPSLSLTTIYTSIKLFRKKGLI